MAPRGRGGAQIWRARAKAIATRVPAGLAQSKNIVSIGDLAKSDNAASTGHAVADITAPGGAHTQRPGSKRKSAKRA
jgi:hypothetical protein